MSAWQGDISELGRLADNLGRLSRIPSQSARSASEGIAKAIDQQFDYGLDPYGRPWTPLKESTVEKKGDDQILVETEAMRESVDVRPMPGAGIQVTIGAEYAGFHQAGFHVGQTKVEPRKILPDREIPDTWNRAISDALDEAWEKSA